MKARLAIPLCAAGTNGRPSIRRVSLSLLAAMVIEIALLALLLFLFTWRPQAGSMMPETRVTLSAGRAQHISPAGQPKMASGKLAEVPLESKTRVQIPSKLSSSLPLIRLTEYQALAPGVTPIAGEFARLSKMPGVHGAGEQAQGGSSRGLQDSGLRVVQIKDVCPIFSGMPQPGATQFLASVDTRGEVKNVRVLASTMSDSEVAAERAALLKWRFRPLEVEGVRMNFSIVYDFRIVTSPAPFRCLYTYRMNGFPRPNDSAPIPTWVLYQVESGGFIAVDRKLLRPTTRP